MLLQHNALGRPRGSLFSGTRFSKRSLGIKASPTFAIRPGDLAFAIGSCFAREVGHMLRDSNIATTFGGFRHRYNVLNILQSLKWALQGGYEPQHLIALDNGRYFDAHHKAEEDEGYATLEQAYDATCHLYSQVGDAIRAANTFVMTLGLSEVWRDERTGTWLNQMPPRAAISDFERKFTVHALRQRDTVDGLLQIFRLVRTARPDMRFICSVSPIPMRATFCHDDVIVGTSNGKATLRSALWEAIEAAHADGVEHVDYFPSYEIVTYQRNDDVYMHRRHGRRDFLHIHREFIDEAIRPVFQQAYLASEAPASRSRSAA